MIDCRTGRTIGQIIVRTPENSWECTEDFSGSKQWFSRVAAPMPSAKNRASSIEDTQKEELCQAGSQVSGQIKELLVDFNSVVKKGQVIARIDPDIFEAKVIQARADLDSAKATVLNQQAQVERSRADVGNARAAHAEARAQTAK